VKQFTGPHRALMGISQEHEDDVRFEWWFRNHEETGEAREQRRSRHKHQQGQHEESTEPDQPKSASSVHFEAITPFALHDHVER
jgi:hypothetical protein